MPVYSIRIHDRLVEEDPHQATVMYAHDVEGPWHDMVTGATDWCWEVLGALEWREQQFLAEREREMNRLRDEMQQARRD